MTPFERLTQLRAQYPPAMTPAQIGALLNALAWNSQASMGLLGKPGGNNVPQPGTNTPISSDYVVHVPTLTGHDVLSGRDDGTTVVVGFEWGPGPEDLRDAIASGARSLVYPVAPGGIVSDGTDVDEPDEPEPPASADTLRGEIARLQGQLNGLVDLMVVTGERLLAQEALHKEVVKQIGMINGQVATLSRRRYTASGRVFGYSFPVTINEENPK